MKLPRADLSKKRPGFEEQEESAARAIGGRRVKGSGCSRRPSAKSDAEGDIFRLEAKTTGRAALPVERAWLEKITAEALATRKRPALAFGFDGSTREDWIAFKASDAQRIMEILRAVDRCDLGAAWRALEALKGS